MHVKISHTYTINLSIVIQNATLTFEIKDCNNFKIKLPLYMLEVQNPLMLLEEKKNSNFLHHKYINLTCILL